MSLPDGCEVLQVWVGSPERPPQAIEERMRHTYERAGTSYRLITDSPYLETVLPNGVIPWDGFAATHNDLKHALGIISKNAWRPECLVSDLVRFWYASRHENVLYVDCDCTLVGELPDIHRGSLWFARYGTEGIEHFMFYSDQPHTMSRLLGAIIMYGASHPGGLQFPDPHRILNMLLSGYANVIEPEHFDHG